VTFETDLDVGRSKTISVTEGLFAVSLAWIGGTSSTKAKNEGQASKANLATFILHTTDNKQMRELYLIEQFLSIKFTTFIAID
jgi:hypothetical protein